VQEAVFTAKLRRYRPDVEPVTVEAVYFYSINDIGNPDLLVDITSCYDIKMKALAAYASQFDPVGQKPAEEHGLPSVRPYADYIPTPLNQGYLERVEARDRLLGMKLQVPHAEGFVTKVPFSVELF
jgi:LmbE family N-acetylglucosaminyl deacetylase